VQPEIATNFPKRAAMLGLLPSALLSILVWNDMVRPTRSLRQLATSRKLVRAPYSISLRSAKRALAVRRAREQKLSLNAYLEALMATELGRPDMDLPVYHIKK
jgi:hypothetical protein